jgi:hypothetical protein
MGLRMEYSKESKTPSSGCWWRPKMGEHPKSNKPLSSCLGTRCPPKAPQLLLSLGDTPEEA